MNITSNTEFYTEINLRLNKIKTIQILVIKFNRKHIVGAYTEETNDFKTQFMVYQ